ncbi:ABC transporter permease [Streptomyces sp. NPDC056661]|uniref:ABC transporter permease n=1 Tax=Streptomyces sp. NPDC056661 TaxID=3345898 RepID=UPI0036C02673
MDPRRTLRTIRLTWWLHLKMLNRSPMELALNIVWPLFFATVALLLYRLPGREVSLSYVAFGASVMTIWTAMSSKASTLLMRERGSGTLELLVAAPERFSLTIVSMIFAVSTVGFYSMITTLLWSGLVFNVDLTVAQPVHFAIAVAVTMLSFAVTGFIICVTIVRYRVAWALGAALEYPVWLLCGFLMPVSLLPEWTRPASWLLPPFWGMAAIRYAVEGRTSWKELAICVSLIVLYAIGGARLTAVLLRSSRWHGTLTLR